jgi:cytochrome P450
VVDIPSYRFSTYSVLFYFTHNIQKTEYIRTLERALVGNGIVAELPWVRAIGRLIPAKVTRVAFDATNYILWYGQRAVDNAKAMGGDSNLMSNVLREAEKEDSQLDDLDVEVEATSLIFAGSGTTANTLTYLIYAVLQRPDLHKQIEEEVSSLPKGFHDSNLENLPILNATLQETLRLYCAVSGTLPRVVPKAERQLVDILIPTGHHRWNTSLHYAP